ncbi:CHASE2 domain-containing protein [Microcoleus sp. bin38.metabat.b11b12b14.051]|uniref:CHASE2 domain-containing protein n=1 Tax=Microcoleus sp. bin38.metabat.b11b12b14.051 TaxID=2742709 RepID=UPI0025F0D350|nr:CHASE2 domain-containing protein [Microcoleus sp. bin38.metabat.b11b12b14.051]
MTKIFNKMRSAAAQFSQKYKSSLFFARSVLIASTAVTLSLVGGRQLGILEPIELTAYDQMVRWRPDSQPDSRLLIVGITEADIQKLKQWPISDRKIAEILQKLEKMQPAVIGLDVLRDVPLGDGREELTKVLQKSDRIIGVCLVTDGSPNNPGSPPPPGMPENRVGFADFGVDPGGILRRALLFMKPPTIEGTSSADKHLCNDSSQVLFSFNLQLTLRYLQGQKILPELAPDQSLWLGKTQLKQLENNDGGYSNADVRGYQILINYRARQQVAKQVTITDILEGKVDPNLVKDKIVLIGYTTETVKDYFYTPYSAQQQNNQFMPGIVAHAQVISQLLSAVLDQRQMFWFWPEWAEVLWISGWSIVGGAVASRMAHPAQLVLAFGGLLSGCCAIGFGIFMLGGWVPVAAPALALILTGGSIISADRFNKAGYGKAISDRVKQVFKIEIDQAKKEQQVAEITESDFFKELQQKKDKLRISKKETSEPPPSPPQEITASVPELPQAESQPDEYLAQLQQKAKQQKQRAAATAAENASKTGAIDAGGTSSGSETKPDEEFSDLQAKAKQMRQRRSQEKKIEDQKTDNLAGKEDLGGKE